MQVRVYGTGLLLAFAMVTTGTGQVVSNRPVTFQVQTLQLGGGTIEVVMRQATHIEPRFVLCNLHDDENTSVEAALEIVCDYPVRLFELKHSGQREVSFPLNGQQFRCDPNRIFTPTGVRSTLAKLSQWNPVAGREVMRLGKQLLELYELPDMKAVVALHNNTEQRYSIISYTKGQEYEKEAQSVSMAEGQDPDDFFFVTDQRLYDQLVKLQFNVVLQDNESVTDDGSLSVYCGKQKIPYVNVESQEGHVKQQVSMLKAVLGILVEDRSKNRKGNP